MSRHDRAIRILGGLVTVAQEAECALGYEVHHDGQEPEVKERQQREMLSHWDQKLQRYHALKRKGASVDRKALPKEPGDYILLEVMLPGTAARVVQTIEMDVLLANSPKMNISIIEAMCKECKAREEL